MEEASPSSPTVTPEGGAASLCGDHRTLSEAGEDTMTDITSNFICLRDIRSAVLYSLRGGRNYLPKISLLSDRYPYHASDLASSRLVFLRPA